MSSLIDVERGRLTGPSAVDLGLVPVRVWQRRVRGWRMPAGATSVARGSGSRPFGNPHEVTTPVTAEKRIEAVRLHAADLRDDPELVALVRQVLLGWSLACFCPPDGVPCHADTLLQVARGEAP